MKRQHPTVCLNMIVKNESAFITRCLDSVKDVIDYWVISDTGSTDGTQAIITRYFDDQRIPGMLTEDSWQDFAHNRNMALKNALGKADYILIMDADDYLIKQEDFQFGKLTADCYMLKMWRGDVEYYYPKLIRANLPWQWQGVLHEYLECSKPFRNEQLRGNYRIASTTDGARSRNPDKYRHDAEVLEKALQKESGNTRYQFYLAQSYRDGGDTEKALLNYQKRADMGGWPEEVYYALLEAARQKQKLGKPDAEVLNGYLQAYNYRPQRLEALHEALVLCRIKGYYDLGFQLGWPARQTRMPDDVLFLEKYVYEWKFLDELSICMAYTPKHREAAKLMEALLKSPATPPIEKPRIEANLGFARR